MASHTSHLPGGIDALPFSGLAGHRLILPVCPKALSPSAPAGQGPQVLGNLSTLVPPDPLHHVAPEDRTLSLGGGLLSCPLGGGQMPAIFQMTFSVCRTRSEVGGRREFSLIRWSFQQGNVAFWRSSIDCLLEGSLRKPLTITERR